MRLTVPPVRFASMMPLAIEADSPIASTSPFSVPSTISAAATAEPTVPQIDVACCPCSK
jgi:hypothetical protein